MPKNILLLHSDQQRQDSLGCYGNAVAQTPNLDGLAAQGIRFSHHYASNPVCMPSRASLYTGRHLPGHGVIDNGIPLEPRVLTLPEALLQQGYTTYAAGKLHCTPYLSAGDSGYGESWAAWRAGAFPAGWNGPYYGFEQADLVLGHGEGPMEAALGAYGAWLAEKHPEAFERKGFEQAPEPKWPGVYRSQVPEEAYHSRYVAERIVQWLEAWDGSQPFFLFAGFPDPHAPFTPPEAWARRFDGRDLPAPACPDDDFAGRPDFFARMKTERLWPKDGGAVPPPGEEEFHHAVQNTYAMVSLIDDSVGQILEALDRLGLAEDTVVAFTSDHGDMLGDHGLLYKCQIPFASLMRIPFIVRAPGLAPRTVAAPMGNADVMPTLMALAGAHMPEGVQGADYSPVITGEKRLIREGVFSCGWSKESPDFRHMSLHGSLWRLTWWPNLHDGELYDLRADPEERENVFYRPEYAELRDRLMPQLLRAYAEAGPLEPPVMCNW